MKHTSKLLLILALVATAMPSVSPASHARSDVARSAMLSASGGGAPTQQSWWGAAAASGCRQSFRYVGTPAFAMFSGLCIVALVDILF